VDKTSRKTFEIIKNSLTFANLFNIMKKIILTIFTSIFLLTNQLAAQTEGPDFMHSTGKIYVVVACIIAIFVGIIAFLIYLERKLTKLESLLED